MLKYLCETEVILVIMAILVCCVFTIYCLLKQGYSRLEKGAKDIINTEEKIIKLIRENYEDRCKNMENVNNVDKFVDKYVYNFKICGLKLLTLEKICGQIFTISLIFALFTSVLSVYTGCGQHHILLTLLILIVSCGAITIFGKNVDNSQKRNIIHIYIVDYLENSIRNKYQKFLFENLEREIRSSNNTLKNKLSFYEDDECEATGIIKQKVRTKSTSINGNTENKKVCAEVAETGNHEKSNLELVFSAEKNTNLSPDINSEDKNKMCGDNSNDISENESTIVNEILKEFLA